MKKKKHLADLMEEDLLERSSSGLTSLMTTKRGNIFSNGLTASSEKGTIRRMPYSSNSGFDAKNGNGRRFKHEQRKSKHGVNAKRRKISLSGANGSMGNGIHRAVSMFSLTPKLTRAFMGRALKTPFCTL